MTVNTASLFLAQITKESQRERSVHLSVPSATQPSQNLPIPPDCVLIQSQETLWPLRAALLWGNTHARRAHVQGPTLLHNTPATTYQPKITQIHTCYCLVIDIVLIGKKAHSSRDLWSFNVRLQKPGSAFRNHDVAAMLLNHLFKASSTQESTLLLAFFSCSSFRKLFSDTGKMPFKGKELVLSLETVPHTSGDDEEFVHVTKIANVEENAARFLHSNQPGRPWGSCCFLRVCEHTNSWSAVYVWMEPIRKLTISDMQKSIFFFTDRLKENIILTDVNVIRWDLRNKPFLQIQNEPFRVRATFAFGWYNTNIWIR